MSTTTLAARPTLTDWLGARWRVGSRAGGVAWGAAAGSEPGDAQAGLVAFALSDGTLAIARRAWEGAPVPRAREGGGVELVAPAAPPPPIARIPVHDGAALAVAADPAGGFLSIGADGQLARVQPDGTIDTLARWGSIGAVAHLATGPGGWRVCAAGATLIRLGVGTQCLDLQGDIAGLAIAPNGACVAVAHAQGLALWSGTGTGRRLAEGEPFATLAWSADARLLAAAAPGGDVTLFDIAAGTATRIEEGRGLRRPLGFTPDGARLVTGGGGAVTSWRVADRAAEPCGIGSKAAAQAIACHPRLPTMACGYANGAVLLCQPGTAEAVFARDADGSGIDALAWAPDGNALAYAAANGETGIVLLPDLLFRNPGARIGSEAA